MAGEQNQPRPGATEPGGAADRAGALVRDQIASIANAAQAAADQIDQEAIDETSQAREQALANAKAVHQGLGAIERELDELHQVVSSQATTLKRSIDRFDARSASAPSAASRSSASTPPPAAAETAPPALTETVDSRAEETTASDASAWAPTEAEPATPAPAPAQAAAQAQAAAAEPGPRTELEVEAWNRVKGKEPAELVALYETATGDRDDDGDEELDWDQYWSAIRQAVISEVRARPQLLIEAPDMSDLGRRARKSRSKAYEALRDEVAAAHA